ncbi:MAG: hypothetical protein ABIJ40_03560 [Bacteroidota bacterium]
MKPVKIHRYTKRAGKSEYILFLTDKEAYLCVSDNTNTLYIPDKKGTKFYIERNGEDVNLLWIDKQGYRVTYQNFYKIISARSIHKFLRDYLPVLPELSEQRKMIENNLKNQLKK